MTGMDRGRRSVTADERRDAFIRELLVVVPSYPPDVYGGVERQAEILAAAMARRGWRITILAPTLTGPRVSHEPTGFGEVVRLRTSALPARGGRHLKATLGWTLRTFSWIVARRRQFAGVYLLHHRLHAAGPLLAASYVNLPIWVKPGGGGEASEFAALRMKKYLYGHAVALLVKRASTGFVANGQMIADDMRREGISTDRIVELSNGVEVLPSDATTAKRPGGRFIYAGRLVHDKRTEVLIQAAALLDLKRDWSLTIVGAGPEQARLQALANDLGLGSRVAFTGKRDDVPRLLLDYDAFVSASPREGQSNALLEAIAAGLIPICVRASGVEDLLGDGRGLIAESPDPQQIARLMEEVLSSRAAVRNDWQDRLRAYARDNLDIDRVAERTLALFSAGAERGPHAGRD